MEIGLYFVVIPLLLVAVLVAMIWSGKRSHPATYKLPGQWTHPPILWAAVDEVVGDTRHGHDTFEFSVGGGASGRW